MSGFAVAVVGDTAGGAISSSPQTHVKLNGVAAVVVGAPIASHGPPPHAAAVCSAGSPFATINGLAVVRTANVATCGDVVAGSSHVSLST